MTLPWRRAAALVRSEKRLSSMVASIVSSQVATGGLGLVFWGIAARAFPHGGVGAAGAATATMLLVASVTQLGQGSLLVSELPTSRRYDRWALVRVARLTAITAAIVVGAGLFAVAGSYGAFHAFSVSQIGWLVAIVGCAVVGESALYDQTMLVIDRPRNQVIRNVVASLTRIALLVTARLVLGPGDSDNEAAAILVAAWAAGWLPSNVLARRSLRRHLSPAPGRWLVQVREHFRRYGRMSLQHHGINTALASGFLVQPVVIGSQITAESNARFTAVRLAAGLVLLVPFAIATGMFTASTDGAGDLVQRSRRATRVSLLLSLTLFAGVLVLADPIIRVLGGDFAAPAANSLRLMSAAGPLLVFKDQYIAVARVRRHLGRALKVVAVGGVLEVVAIAVGAQLGELNGALEGWLVVLAVESAVAFQLMRRELQAFRPTSAA